MRYGLSIPRLEVQLWCSEVMLEGLLQVIAWRVLVLCLPKWWTLLAGVRLFPGPFRERVTPSRAWIGLLWVDGVCCAGWGLRLSRGWVSISFNHANRSANRKRRLPYRPKCNGGKITHLSFTDDLFIFTDESLQAVIEVQSICRNFIQFLAWRWILLNVKFSSLEFSELPLIKFTVSLVLKCLLFL